jgi:hypothetical protein
MPNWSFNYLIVEGDKDEVSNFQKFVYPKYKNEGRGEEQEVIDFNAILPYPDEQQRKDLLLHHARNLKHCQTQKEKEVYYVNENITEDMKKEMLLLNLEDEDATSFMGWHAVNWGTKWNACYSKVDNVDENTLLYRFDTAWSPPIRVFAKMVDMFPNLTFTILFGEEGMFFSGRVRVKGKKVYENIQGPYKRNWAYPVKFMKKYKLTKLMNYIK